MQNLSFARIFIYLLAWKSSAPVLLGRFCQHQKICWKEKVARNSGHAKPKNGHVQSIFICLLEFRVAYGVAMVLVHISVSQAKKSN